MKAQADSALSYTLNGDRIVQPEVNKLLHILDLLRELRTEGKFKVDNRCNQVEP
jgi:hypothetical protein